MRDAFERCAIQVPPLSRFPPLPLGRGAVSAANGGEGVGLPGLRPDVELSPSNNHHPLITHHSLHTYSSAGPEGRPILAQGASPGSRHPTFFPAGRRPAIPPAKEISDWGLGCCVAETPTPDGHATKYHMMTSGERWRPRIERAPSVGPSEVVTA